MEWELPIPLLIDCSPSSVQRLGAILSYAGIRGSQGLAGVRFARRQAPRIPIPAFGVVLRSIKSRVPAMASHLQCEKDSNLHIGEAYAAHLCSIPEASASALRDHSEIPAIAGWRHS
ncbi:hypothetical protein [Cohnella mopanensis]|uniref:hypothetical protein n=1 Tax=Cohnella mopanensis TaxID=2911966 RepID=UPI001EF89525|nr:hypothetical protein [Cohnella mopanensis]